MVSWLYVVQALIYSILENPQNRPQILRYRTLSLFLSLFLCPLHVCVSPVSFSPGVSLFSLSVHLSVSVYECRTLGSSFLLWNSSTFSLSVTCAEKGLCTTSLPSLCCITGWVGLCFSDYTKFRHGFCHWLGAQSKIFFQGRHNIWQCFFTLLILLSWCTVVGVYG